MTQLPQVIAFTGKAGSGKTTAANWVLRNHPKAMKMSFAQPLKVMMYELIRQAIPKKWPHAPKEYVDGGLKEEPIPFLANRTGRELMQSLGTEWGRNAVQEDFWVQIAQGKLERMLGAPLRASDTPQIKAVYDDARFQNELDMIRSYGGLIIGIKRPTTVIQSETAASHASEQQPLTPDTTIINDGTEDDLIAKLAEILPPTPKA